MFPCSDPLLLLVGCRRRRRARAGARGPSSLHESVYAAAKDQITPELGVFLFDDQRAT